MLNKLVHIEHFMPSFFMNAAYYPNWSFNLPLNEANVNNPLLSDRYDYKNYMYVGTTSPIGYVLGNIVEHVDGMTYALTGTDASRFSISAIGEITLADNTGLVAGTLTFNVVHNLLGTIPISVPVVSPSSPVAFYDSVNGSEANSGRQPHLPKLVLDRSTTGWQPTLCIRRGSTYSQSMRFGNNNTFRAYGNPIAPQPILTAPAPQIANITNADKSGQPGVPQGCSNVLIEDFDIRCGPTVGRGVHLINVQNGVVKRCTVSGNAAGANSQAFVASGNCTGIVFRHCECRDYNGDGIYITHTWSGANEVSFCHLRPPFGSGTADCLQITGQNNFGERCKQFKVSHNIIDYGIRAWIGSGKGACVIQETDGYLFEYNLVKGGYFGIGAMGSRGTLRFNYFFSCRFNNTANNEWGCGQGANQYSMEHAYYGNYVDFSNRGMIIGGYGAPAGGWRRPDMEFMFNTVMNCWEPMRCAERWTGEISDNIFVNNGYGNLVNNTGNGLVIADVTGTVTITQTAGVATVTFNNHYMGVGDLFTIEGANEAGYNLVDAPVTSTPNQNSFRYAVDPATPSPATGTITYRKKRKYTTQTISNIGQNYLGSRINTPPTVTGTVQDGQTLTCNITAQAGITYTYQWLLNGNRISAATSSTYSIPALTSNSINRFMPDQANFAEIQCLVVATDANGMKTNIFARFPNGLLSQRVVA